MLDTDKSSVSFYLTGVEQDTNRVIRIVYL